MIKAPKAGENPTFEAKITIIKHKANEIISNISSVSRCFAFLKIVGMIKIPPKNQMIKKKTSFKTDCNNAVPET
ncbi:hypothetical protein D3C80_1054860 [compost metagenome]